MEINALVGGYARDLEYRCERLLVQLSERQLHPDTAWFYQNIIQRLRQIQRELRDLPNSDRLRHEPLWRYGLSDYTYLAYEVAIVEQFAIPVLLRYADRDSQFFQLVKAIIREIGYPDKLVPIVITTSDQYYWSQPEFRIVGVPAGDLDGGILGWPDLLHELAHLLLAAWYTFLVNFTPIVSDHFRNQRDRLADLGGPKKDSQWLAVAQIMWGEKREGTWRIELAADMIATYLIGPAYGWQHIRLAVNHGTDPYYPSPDAIQDHPADQARLDGILAMLKLLGLKREANEIEAHWSQLLDLDLYKQPPLGYELYYPASLIQKLAELVYAGCQEQGLISFRYQSQSDQHLVTTINRAWQAFNQNPATFPEWESDTMRKLKNSFRPINVAAEPVAV